MVSRAANSVTQYLADLPAERRQVVAAVRRVIRKHLPPGYRETMNWGMISYEIPLRRYPKTYNGQPLAYVGLAAQKQTFSLYLMGVYANPVQAKWLRQQFRDAGKKLDMGKSCLRFRRLEDLPLGVIGQVVASTSVGAYIAGYEASRRR